MGKNEKGKKGESNEIFSYSPEGRKEEKRRIKARNKRRKPWKRIIAAVLSVILAVTGVGLIIFYNTISSVNFKHIDTHNNNNDDDGTGDFGMSNSSSELLNDPMVLNIMLFGEDSRKGEETQGRSDTMLMLSIDNRHKKLKLTSFMRDSLITIPGTDDAGNDYGLNKLNAAYTYGGPALSIKTIESNFGVAIDRYAVVDFESFKSIIDTLGGVDIELTQEEIDYINWQTYLNGQSTDRNEIKDSPGVVHLNGRQALWYSRDRGYQEEEHPEVVISGDDFDRTNRQRNLLTTIMKSMKDANMAQIVSIVGNIGPMITTNLKKDELTTLVANSLTYLSYDMEQFRLPLDEYYRYDVYNQMSVLIITDMEETRLELAKFIYEDSISRQTKREIEAENATNTEATEETDTSVDAAAGIDNTISEYIDYGGG